MKQNDIIMLNVTGTNHSTRNRNTISRTFNGAGQKLDDNGKVDASSAEVLRKLPTGESAPAPQFPGVEYAAAAEKGDAVKLKEIMVAHASRMKAWEESLGGGNEQLQIAKSVLEYTKEFHDFRETDEGDYFILKADDLDVTVKQLTDGHTLFQVTGTAVFGA